MPIISRFLIIATLAGILVGCARFPEGSSPITVREMSFRIDFVGPINDNYRYFVAIDSTGGPSGPVPVFPVGDLSGEDWVTGAATHFVEYFQGQYTVYSITNLQPFERERIGTPIRFVRPDVGANTLRFTIDLDTIEAEGESINVNIIALNQLMPEGRLLDGLGPLGADYLNIDIRSSRTFINADAPVPEGPGDVLDQNRSIRPVNEQTAPLDILDWSITVEM